MHVDAYVECHEDGFKSLAPHGAESIICQPDYRPWKSLKAQQLPPKLSIHWLIPENRTTSSFPKNVNMLHIGSLSLL